MRPPDLPGGNTERPPVPVAIRAQGFNEAAGFTRRKHPNDAADFQSHDMLQ